MSKSSLHRISEGEYLLYGTYRIENHGYDRVTGNVWWVGFSKDGKEITRGMTLRSVVSRLENHIGESEEICKTYPKLKRVGDEEYLYDGYFRVRPTGRSPAHWESINEEGKLIAVGITLNDCVESLVRELNRANTTTINGDCCI